MTSATRDMKTNEKGAMIGIGKQQPRGKIGPVKREPQRVGSAVCRTAERHALMNRQNGVTKMKRFGEIIIDERR